MRTKFTKILSDSGKLLRNEDVVGLKTDSNMWKVRLLVMSSVIY